MVCVKATHLEARGKKTPKQGSKNPFKGKDKENGFKGKKNASINKEGEKLTCKHCSKEGHDEAHYWKLQMKPKKFNNKGKQKIVATTQEELGSDSGDETKITAMCMKGKESIASTITSNLHNETPNKKKRI